MTMKVGHAHKWRYRSDWREKKTRPGIWKFHSRQLKQRQGRQYSKLAGARVGTRFTWNIRARQYMTKVSPNTYRGFMKGVKRFITRR